MPSLFFTHDNKFFTSSFTILGGGATNIHVSPENTPSSPFLNSPDSLTVLYVINPCIFFKSLILDGLISGIFSYAAYAFLTSCISFSSPKTKCPLITFLTSDNDKELASIFNDEYIDLILLFRLKCGLDSSSE